MSVKLPRYTTRDYGVLAILIIPVTLIINSVIFGGSYFTDWRKFLFASAVTAAVFCVDFIICGWVAVMMKKDFRLPHSLASG
ncbi:MAG: hypothetical protein IPP99_10795 [Chitinophagaceae bacterium]|nr:hypothetical protein [Chitinophagaceae bacterium]